VVGVPVVGTDSGGPAELIEDGKRGFIVPPGDPQAIAKALRTLLKDPSLRSQMIEQARQRAQERFDLKRVVEEVEAVYARTVS
jgi:glycosyltransferase involved in cell wall biosynthesis